MKADVADTLEWVWQHDLVHLGKPTNHISSMAYGRMKGALTALFVHGDIPTEEYFALDDIVAGWHFGVNYFNL